MSQKTALYIALGLTTFILVAVGSIALAWPALQSPQDAISQTAPALDANADPQTLLATVQARDAAYRTQIEQANSQLEQAYQQLSELKAQNQILQQREQIYRQRLQESAQIIEAMSAANQANQPNIAFASEHEEHEEHDDD